MSCGPGRNPENCKDAARKSHRADPGQKRRWWSSSVAKPHDQFSVRGEHLLSTKMKPLALSKSKEFQRFKGWLHEAKRVLISTHALPDGDGLGAEAALFHYLKRARKACRVYNPDQLPKRYRFLDPKANVLLGPGEVELWDTCDLWVIVDPNDPPRPGTLWPHISIPPTNLPFL